MLTASFFRSVSWNSYSFVADSHNVLTYLVAFMSFLVFKNWRIPQSRFINAVASTTFGVLLIHAATGGMIKWLWQDFVNVPSAYQFRCSASLLTP